VKEVILAFTSRKKALHRADSEKYGGAMARQNRVPQTPAYHNVFPIAKKTHDTGSD